MLWIVEQRGWSSYLAESESKITNSKEPDEEIYYTAEKSQINYNMKATIATKHQENNAMGGVLSPKPEVDMNHFTALHPKADSLTKRA